MLNLNHALKKEFYNPQYRINKKNEMSFFKEYYNQKKIFKI